MSVYELKESRYDKQAIILRCDCNSDTHQLEFSYVPDDDFDELIIGVTLNRPSFFRRLVVAVRYIFNWPGKYGPYEETLVANEDVGHLMSFLDKYIQYRSRKALEWKKF